MIEFDVQFWPFFHFYGNSGYWDHHAFNADNMIRPIKHHKASKHQTSKRVRFNVSMHPFVLVAIAAALTVVVFVIVVYFLRYIK